MQTFMTHKGYEPSLQALDNARANKQIQECWVIYQILESMVDGGSFAKHPAVLMWSGHQGSLLQYTMCALDIWARKKDIRRRTHHGLHDRIAKEAQECREMPYKTNPPPWLGNPNFHRSHRSNLIRKDRNFYEDQFPKTPELMPYLWPTIVPTDSAGYRLRLSQADKNRLNTGERVLPDWLELIPNSLEIIENG